MIVLVLPNNARIVQNRTANYKIESEYADLINKEPGWFSFRSMPFG